MLVDHQNAVVHILNNQLTDLLHAGQVDFALRGKLFSSDQIFGQGMRHPGGGKITNAEKTSLHILGNRRGILKHFGGLLD